MNNSPYKASINNIRLKLLELQEDKPKTKENKDRQLSNKNQKVINIVLHHQDLFFIPKPI